MDRNIRRKLDRLQSNGRRVITPESFEADQKKAEEVFLKRREEFVVQISMYNALFGVRFAGRLKFNNYEIMPHMRIEKIPKDRLKEFRINDETRTPEALKEVGFLKVILPQKLTPWQKFIYLIPSLRKAAFMDLYAQACLRFNMLCFAFIAEQQGALVAAVDYRDMSNYEREALLLKVGAAKVRTEEQQNAPKEETSESGESSAAKDSPDNRVGREVAE